jgi:hypothetical protein
VAAGRLGFEIVEGYPPDVSCQAERDEFLAKTGGRPVWTDDAVLRDVCAAMGANIAMWNHRGIHILTPAKYSALGIISQANDLPDLCYPALEDRERCNVCGSVPSDNAAARYRYSVCFMPTISLCSECFVELSHITLPA